MLGKGGFGHVETTRDPNKKQLCAIKLFESPENNGKFQILERQIREIYAMDQISKWGSKNFVELYDYYFIKGDNNKLCVGIVMQLGAFSLNQYFIEISAHKEDFEKNKDLHLSNFVLSINAMFEGLQLLQEHDSIHSDIKPDNLMMVLEGENKYLLKFVDFTGFISFADFQENGLPLCETKGYMPEEAKVKWGLKTREDFFKIDLFATGRILREFWMKLDGLGLKRKIMEDIGELIDRLDCSFKDIQPLKKCREFFEKVLSDNHFDISDYSFNFSPNFIDKMIFKSITKESFDKSKFEKIMNYYKKIGEYSRALSFLNECTKHKKPKIDQTILKYHYCTIHSLLQNNPTVLAECYKYDKKTDIPDDERMFVKSGIITKICECPSKQDELEENFDFLEKRFHHYFDHDNAALRNFFIQQAVNNLIFAFCEKFRYKDALFWIEKVEETIKKNNLSPKESKNINEDDEDNLNFFFAKFYNSKLYFWIRFLAIGKSYSYDCLDEFQKTAEKFLLLVKTLTEENTIFMSVALNNIGCLYINMRKLEQNTLDLLIKAKNIRKDIKNNSKSLEFENFLMKPDYSIGLYYYMLNKYGKPTEPLDNFYFSRAEENLKPIYDIRKSLYETHCATPCITHSGLIEIKITYALCLMELKRFDEAKKILKELKQLFKDNPILNNSFLNLDLIKERLYEIKQKKI